MSVGAGERRRVERTTGTGRGLGAKMSWPALSRAIGSHGHRHHPGRTGLRRRDANQPFAYRTSRKVEDFVRNRKWRTNLFWQR